MPKPGQSRLIAATPLMVIEQACAWLAAGEAVALVTLVGIEGAASRALGTQMAITGSGQHIGSFSGGCIEAAIVAEAQRVLDAGAGRTVRYGAGSPYIDVRLPCGGGLDLMFTPYPSAKVLAGAITLLRQRQPVRLCIRHEGVWPDGDSDGDGDAGGFALRLWPPLRILAAGQGEDLTAFVHLALAHGARVEVLSPAGPQTNALADTLAGTADRHHRLTHTSQPPAITGDDWTAIVFLFHDHDWEDALLPYTLRQRAFYHGAIGSQRTHAARLARLEEAGCDAALRGLLKGHIGLIPATRDPATLAISVLAEVVAGYAALCARAA